MYGKDKGDRVTETPSVSPRPLSGIHIPLSGAPVSAYGRAAYHPTARVCVPLDAAVTRVTCTCPARRGPARRGCHSCDGSGGGSHIAHSTCDSIAIV